MNKRNITINTQFYEDGESGHLESYHAEQPVYVEGQQLQSSWNQQQSLPVNYQNQEYIQYIPKSLYEGRYDGHQLLQMSTRKLEAANLFQNIISRAMANLFVKCWEQMKALLPEYEYLVQRDGYRRNEEIIQDYNNVFGNNEIDNNLNTQNQQVEDKNVFVQSQQAVEDRLREVLERQRKGITLSSLEKQKLNRSKSMKKGQTIKSQGKNLKVQQSKQTVAQAETSSKQDSRISRKSYRDKFLQYKHRSRSKDTSMLKGQTYTKLRNYLPHQNSLQNLHPHNSSPNFVSHPYRNIHSSSNIQQSKSALLKNISSQLMDREEIFQGGECNYYFNHRDRLRNVVGMDREGGGEKDNQETEFVYDAEEEVLRAKLLDQIVAKLHFSKIRIQEVEKNKSEDYELIKKIAKLEKVVLDLKNQRQTRSSSTKVQPIYIQVPQQPHQQSQLSKKFLQQISLIRIQLNLIKSNNQPIPQYYPPIDNSSSQIIIEQQKLLANYQRQFQKLLMQKQQASVIRRQQETKVESQEPKTETAQKSIFQQLIDNGKNSAKKVGWDDGWEQRKQQVNRYQQVVQSANEVSRMTKSRRNQHMNRQDTFQKYRYTRNQVLEDIGLKSQVQQEQRIWRQAQARQLLDRQKREQEVRKMTQKVKQFRQEQNLQENIQRNKPIRQRYEQQWQHFQKTRININQNQNPCCVLFPC